MEADHDATGADEWRIDKIFPNASQMTISNEIADNLPYKIRNIYQETVQAFNDNLDILCSAGIRSVIQAICLDKKIYSEPAVSSSEIKKDPPLWEQINGLVHKKYLTRRNASTLHKLRFIGNDALHKLEKPSKEELIKAIKIIEIILTSIYVLSVENKKLTESINKRLSK